MRKESFPAQRRHKLSPRGDGPFRVLRRINNNAYQLELPDEYNINTSFNIADLTLYERGNEEADRLMDQPPQGGGDDAGVRSTQLINSRKPESKKQVQEFLEEMQQLIEDLTSHPDQFFQEEVKIINFKKLIEDSNNFRKCPNIKLGVQYCILAQNNN